MNTALSSAPQTEEAIKDIVEKHRVCYEWSNDHEMVNSVRIPTGYSLRLYGSNDEHDAGIDSGTHPIPGCAACRKTYFDLLSVAKWIMPKEKRETQYKIEPFDNAFHFAPKRNWREEIVVAIQLLHRDDVSRPQDECEILCLKEMCSKLQKIGVLEGRVNREFGRHN
ncbi:MAG: hypothetical protein IPM59_03710 [Chloracidobacterium sp.]|nr:hypothetical protein [Chloracidobacterium sp.]